MRCLVLGLVALALGLTVNTSCFEMSQDGAGWQSFMDYQVKNREAYSQLGADAHQGNFDVYYPLINDYTIPGAVYRLIGLKEAPSPTAYYAIYSVALFALVFALGWTFGVDVVSSLLAASIALFFFPPLVARSGALTFRFMQLNPHWMQLIILSAIIILSTWKLDGKWTASRLVLIVLPALAATVEILSVGAMVIFTPAVAAYGAGALYFSKNRQAAIQKIAAGALAVAVIVLSGQATYLYGTERYSAYEVFGYEFDWDQPYFANLSIAFDYPFGLLLIVLGLVGARIASREQTGLIAQLGKTHLMATGLFFAACAFFYVWSWFAGYRSSSPLYFETTYMPFAALFTAYAIVHFTRRRLERAARFRTWASQWHPRQAALLCLWFLILTIGTINIVASVLVPDLCYDRQAYGRIRSNAIVEEMRKNVALSPGAPFRGNVATIDWVGDKEAVDFSVMYRMNLTLRAEIGNDLRMFGLWHFGIPTMYQYFTFITAPYYLLTTEFLSRPQDRQTRSGLVLTQIDPKMLRLWGVRYVVTDHQTDAGREVTSLHLRDGRDVRLIELDSPNLGNYSPTAVKRVESFHEGLALMHEPAFDGTRTVISDESDPPIGGALVPATDVQLTYETYGFHIQAKSTGTSVLVLPPQFSRCWTVSGSGSPRLFRANMMQLGVAFSENLDARLVLKNGPLLAGACRIDDLNDIKRLDIAHGRVAKRILPN